MPTFPHIIYGTCTKSDSSAYNGFVWLTNETTTQTVKTSCNSSGQYAYDLANMDSYSNGQIIKVSIEAYGTPSYLLTNEPFDDSSVDTIEFDGQRLNNAELTVNFKVNTSKEKNKARVNIFHDIFSHLNKDPPSYTDRDGETQTYEIVSAFPEISPTFPCIVVNPIEKKLKKLGVAKRPNASYMSSITLEFYAKTSDGKNAIDIARDKVEFILQNNWISEDTTIDTSGGGQVVNVQGVE